MDWLEIEDDGESFAALRALSLAEKQALFAACVARTVNPQLAFEPQARPELEATVARLDIDFAKHVRPTAAMLVVADHQEAASSTSPARCSVSPGPRRGRRAGKPVLAEAMETAFAAGDRPVSLSACHARGGARLDTARLRGVRHRAHR